jgi:hypothetical protein
MGARRSAAAFLAVVTIGLGASAHAASPADPYEALKRFDGVWRVTTSTGRNQTVENHCARTGLFFVCEQAVGGEAAALVVFLPKGRKEGGETYRIQTLTAAGDAPRPWRQLTIDGDRWTYGDGEGGRAKGRHERVINTFSGPDYIHYETQVSTDGETWTTTRSGDEHRGP